MRDHGQRASNDDTPEEPIETRWADAARALAQAIWHGKPYAEQIRALMLIRAEEASKRRGL